MQLQTVALELFGAKGYDNVSSSELAAAASVTERTFFRYFATKDSVVLWYLDDDQGAELGDLDGHDLAGDLTGFVESRARWVLRGDADRQLLFDRIRLIRATPSLHTQWVAKNHRAANLLADRLAGARPGDDPLAVRVRCVATFATACVVAEQWAADGGLGDLDETLGEAWRELFPA